MLSFLRKLLWRGPPSPTPVQPGMIANPTNIPVPANDPSPLRPPRIFHTRMALRHMRNNMLVMPGEMVITVKGATMQVAANVKQQPPYVICIYRGRRIAVRPDTIACYFIEVAAEAMQ